MVIISYESYMLYAITCMDFPDVDSMLCVTLHGCVFWLLLWILSLLLQQKVEDVCG